MILRVENIRKQYRIAGVKKQILDGLDLSLEGGRICSITGMSGCGKTTLLNVIAGITRPGAGAVYINGRRMIHGLDILASRRRNREIGFVFQTFRLLNDETVLSNVLLPARIRGRVGAETREAADEILERLRIYKFRKTKAAVLSGGQKQRVAIARALVNRPSLILADEPTANLDRETAQEIFDILLDLKESGKAILIVTHDEYMHRQSDRVCVMEDGTLRGAV
ncbi:MAG: ABC transporter ATP-binding protein [Spirochaetes bacterium]|nr:ABC transporter ATP-binding protein [Spirochaetota bacterium]